MRTRLQAYRATAGLWLAVCLIAITCAASYRNLLASAEVRTEVAHTRDMRLALTQALSSLQDAETGQRGYLLTGKDSYLAPYTSAVQQMPFVLARLQELTRDDPSRQRPLMRLRTLVGVKLQEMAMTIQLRRQAGLPAALRVVEADLGKHTMDDIRLLLQQMNTEGDRRLADRQAREAITHRSTLLIVIGGDAVLFLLLLLATATVQRELAERRRAESSLRRSEQHYATTLRGIGDAVIATDAQGCVTFMNAVAEQLTGWTAQDAAGQDSRRVFHIVNEQTRQEVESPIVRVLREGTIVGLANHTILIARDGREVPIDDSGAPIRDEHGAITGTVLVFRDITERNRTEAEREAHRAKVEELNARLQRAMAESHHRIKNHLQMLAALVEMQTGEGDTVPRSAMSRLNQHIRSLAALHDILTSEAKVGNDMELISMQEAFGKLLPMLQASAGHRHIAVDVEDVSLPLKQAGTYMLLTNELLSNAIKHGKGEIALRFGLDGERLHLEVSDDGPGFPPAFDPETEASTGLELIESLSRWDLNGRAAYENRAEGGARVVITVPLPSEAIVFAGPRESRQEIG